MFATDRLLGFDLGDFSIFAAGLAVVGCLLMLI
jgi:hypothetical protein